MERKTKQTKLPIRIQNEVSIIGTALTKRNEI